jgi:hypothetical protein
LDLKADWPRATFATTYVAAWIARPRATFATTQAAPADKRHQRPARNLSRRAKESKPSSTYFNFNRAVPQATARIL